MSLDLRGVGDGSELPGKGPYADGGEKLSKVKAPAGSGPVGSDRDCFTLAQLERDSLVLEEMYPKPEDQVALRRRNPLSQPGVQKDEEVRKFASARSGRLIPFFRDAMVDTGIRGEECWVTSCFSQEKIVRDQDWLERMHSVIQWLLPTITKSLAQPESPYLTEEIIEAFDKNRGLTDTLAEHAKSVLPCWGMKVDEWNRSVKATSDYPEIMLQLLHGHHGLLRINRFFDSLLTFESFKSGKPNDWLPQGVWRVLSDPKLFALLKKKEEGERDWQYRRDTGSELCETFLDSAHKFWLPMLQERDPDENWKCELPSPKRGGVPLRSVEEN